jgi:hypothetical protein
LFWCLFFFKCDTEDHTEQVKTMRNVWSKCLL